MATLKDIAKEAGVSIMTVSNVINGRTEKVSEENRSRILKIVKKHNYIPNLSARSLSSKNSKIIGVIIPTFDPEDNIFLNPYISELFGIIEQAVRKNGYHAMVLTVETVSDIDVVLKNWNVAGAIFLLPSYDNLIDDIKSTNPLPMVFIDSYADNNSIIKVNIDDYRGGYIATEYLIKNGHQKIAFAGPDWRDSRIIKQRFQGYKDALRKANISYNPNFVISTDPTYEKGVKLGKDFSNNNYDMTAVFCTADIMAIGVMEGCRLSGMKVPEDLSVVGFDNLLPCIYTTPKLTTISQNIVKKGQRSVNLLIDAIENGLTNTSELLDVELVARGSVQKLR